VGPNRSCSSPDDLKPGQVLNHKFKPSVESARVVKIRPLSVFKLSQFGSEHSRHSQSVSQKMMKTFYAYLLNTKDIVYPKKG
jgi:hypothetical protein